MAANAVAIRDAADAKELLTHRRTGHLTPFRRLAKNTKLIYVTDSLAALTFHEKPLVWYSDRGCVIDLQGWHTTVTWRRVGQFTLARPVNFTLARPVNKDMLWYIQTPNDMVLYEPKIRLDAAGNVVNPMLPRRQRQIANAAAHAIKLLQTAARKGVEAWDDLTTQRRPCARCASDEYIANELSSAHTERAQHFISHFVKGEWVLPAEFLSNPQLANLHPDQIVNKMRHDYAKWLIIVNKMRHDYAKWLMRDILPIMIEMGDPMKCFRFHYHPNFHQKALQDNN